MFRVKYLALCDMTVVKTHASNCPQLPAKHEEGKLVVRHRGKEVEFDFSEGSGEG